MSAEAELLRIYHFFLRSLSFEQLPELVYRTLGDAGFGPLAKLFASTTKNYIEKFMGTGDPVELIEKLRAVASAARDAIGEEPLFQFSYKLEEGRRLVVDVPFSVEEPVDVMRAAVMLGILAGIIEASGRNVYIVRDPEKASRHVPKGSVLIYIERGSPSRIVAEILE